MQVYGSYSKPEIPRITPYRSLAYFWFQIFRNDRKTQQFWRLRPVIFPKY